MKRLFILAVAVLGFGYTISLPATAQADVVCDSFLSTQDDGNTVGATSQVKGAQSFTVSSTCSLTAVQLSVNKYGSPSGSLGVYVYSDSGGVPDTLLATCTPLTGGGTGGAYVMTSTACSYSLSAGTTYWLLWSLNQAYSGSNGWNVGAHDGSTGGRVGDTGSWSSTYLNGAGWKFLYELDASSPATGALGGATSTVDQSQENLTFAFFLYFVVFLGVVWLLGHKH